MTPRHLLIALAAVLLPSKLSAADDHKVDQQTFYCYADVLNRSAIAKEVIEGSSRDAIAENFRKMAGPAQVKAHPETFSAFMKEADETIAAKPTSLTAFIHDRLGACMAGTPAAKQPDANYACYLIALEGSRALAARKAGKMPSEALAAAEDRQSKMDPAPTSAVADRMRRTVEDAFETSIEQQMLFSGNEFVQCVKSPPV